MPRSSAASSTSFSSTGIPALANTIAIPPPIVPEPTTATRFTGQHRSFLGNVGNLRHLALAKENMDERLRLIGEKAFGEELRLRLTAFIERQSRPRLYRIDRRQGSLEPALLLARRVARRGKDRARSPQPFPASPFAPAFWERACRQLRARKPPPQPAGLLRSTGRSIQARPPHARKPACPLHTSPLPSRHRPDAADAAFHRPRE